MKPEQIYQELKDLAEKLNITVLEQNLSISGFRVKSGYCKVKGKDFFVIDKKKSIYKKNHLLVAYLRTMPHENIYVVPAVRELLQKQSRK